MSKFGIGVIDITVGKKENILKSWKNEGFTIIQNTPSPSYVGIRHSKKNDTQICRLQLVDKTSGKST